MIVGKNVRLRAIEKEDLVVSQRWLNDREVTRFLLHHSPLSMAMEEKWYESQMAIPPESGQVLAIETQVAEKWVYIGNTGLHHVDPVTREAEFGIFIGEKEFWGKGLGREATYSPCSMDSKTSTLTGSICMCSKTTSAGSPPIRRPGLSMREP